VGHNQGPHFIGVYRGHVRHVAHVFGWLSERLAQQLQGKASLTTETYASANRGRP
jgi:hypothetical protein